MNRLSGAPTVPLPCHHVFLLILCFLSHTQTALNARPTISFVPEGIHVTFHAKAAFHKFSGTTPSVSGEVEFPAIGNLEGVTGVVHIAAGSLKTGIRRRDRAMYRLLEVDQFPEIVYAFQTVLVEARNEQGVPERIRLSGTVTVRGQERPLQLSGRLEHEEGRVTVGGSGELDMQDFGLKPPRILFWKVQSVIQVTFRVSLEVPLRLLLGKPEEK